MMKKVLIVDDNDANLYLLKSMLEDEGFTVVAAENGQVALDSAHANPPDLIVSDILMPVMDGYALCRRWKSDDTLKHIPLVFYTATYTGSKNENFALSLGADRFILKPQEPDNLMDILEEVLEESYVAKQVAAKPLEEEMEVFRQYNEILFSKLEKKMSDLEIANQELKESEERYRRVSSMTSDITYSCSTREDGRFAIEWMTGATEHISGYSIEEIKVQNCWRFMVIEEDLALFEEKVINLAPGSHGFCELRIRHRNGDIVWLASHAECVMDTETPERFHLYGGLVDITASKRAEEKENEASALLRIAGEKAKLGGWSVNLEENRVSWSDEVAAIHEMPAGYSPSVEQGISFYAPEWRERITTVFTDCAQKGIPYDEQMEIITAGGKRVWVKTIGEAVKDKAGKIVKVQGAFQDITDSKQAKDMLQDSKELFALFMRYSPVYAYIKEVTPTESRVLQASDNYEQMIGIPGPKMIGRSMVELFPPEFAQKITDDDWAVVSLGNVLQLDEDFNGRHYTSIKFPIRQKSKTLLAGYTIDITDRKRTEEALRERDILFKKLSFHVPGMIYQFMRRHDGTYCVPFSTEAIKDIFGCSPEDVREDFSPITRVVLPEDLNKLIDSIEASAEHMTTWQCEYRVQIPGQPIRWMFGLSTPGNLADGSVIWHGFNMDITDSKHAEEALQNSETRFKEMFEGAPIGYHELDNEGRVNRVNRTELAILGYSAEEMLGRHVWEFVDEKDIVRKAVLDKLLGILPPGENLERYYCKKDGTRIPVLIQDLIIRDKDGKITGIRSTLQDITNRKLADKQLQDTLKSLRKAVGTTIQVMVSAVETRDPYTAGHQTRSADLARAIAIEMGLSQEKTEGLRMAGSIHDIGKLSIPAEILSKPIKLSELEFSLIKEHSRKGYEMLKDVESPWPLAEIVHQHHERVDGSGYPRNLKGDEILIEARILSVADVVEAMASHRPYRPGLGIDAALEEISKNRGILYDTGAVNACLRLFHEKGYKID